MTQAPPIAITMGDPLGIGAEITLKSWRLREDKSLPPFFVIGDPAWIADHQARLDFDVPVQIIASPGQTSDCFHQALPLLPLATSAGNAADNAATKTLRSIEMAVEFCMQGQAGAVVTNPIQKKRLYEAGFAHPGHTEYLAHLTTSKQEAVMMLCCSELRVVPLTVHIPLSAVSAAITEELIENTVRTMHRDLVARSGIIDPVIKVCGLNPHAGEEGSMGEEEKSVIAPAIAKLKRDGINISGPYPADSLFHADARKHFDIALCMYHDQALIPLKTLDFANGVNVTLGLPIIRTSPDHGTAEKIMGKGIASPASLIAAIKIAREMTENDRR